MDLAYFMTYIRAMKRVNVHEAKSTLSTLLASGERVLICNRNVPIAELRPLKRAKVRRTEPRPLVAFARAKGIVMTDAFFERDGELERLFDGEDA